VKGYIFTVSCVEPKKEAGLTGGLFVHGQPNNKDTQGLNVDG